MGMLLCPVRIVRDAARLVRTDEGLERGTWALRARPVYDRSLSSLEERRDRNAKVYTGPEIM